MSTDPPKSGTANVTALSSVPKGRQRRAARSQVGSTNERTEDEPTGQSVDEFIDSLEGDERRDDCRALVAMMAKATKAPAEMWGSGIVGFGRQPYRGANGKTVEWMTTAFAPRKSNLTLYLWSIGGQKDLLAKLGKHSTGQGCLYIKRLAGVHVPTLKKLIDAAVSDARAAVDAAAKNSSRQNTSTVVG